jgi:hypothetical protein
VVAFAVVGRTSRWFTALLRRSNTHLSQPFYQPRTRDKAHFTRKINISDANKRLSLVFFGLQNCRCWGMTWGAGCYGPYGTETLNLRTRGYLYGPLTVMDQNKTTAATPAVQNPVIRAVGNQPSATHQADITARLPKGKYELPSDAEGRANSKRVVTAAKDSRNLDEKPPSKCFRISGIPSSWRTDEIFRALQSIDPSLDFQNHQLSLYPACVGSKKVALIQLNSSEECQ